MLGTREIEESISSHPNVSEVAVVGVADKSKGQVAAAFDVPKQAGSTDTPQQQAALEAEIMAVVDRHLGSVGRPARVHCVTLLPKSHTGKQKRQLIQSICVVRDPGDATTIEDPAALEQIHTTQTKKQCAVH